MAARFFVGGNGNNWGATAPTNWSTTSGGAPGAAVPTNADDVTFDAVSPNCTIDTTGRVCRRITFAAYTNTITFNQNLTATPDTGSTGVILGASMIFAGSSTFVITGPASGTTSITSNGKTVSVPVTFSGNSTTITLNDNWTISGLVTFSSGNMVMNSNSLNCSGSFTHAAGNNSGTTVVTATGTGTWNRTGGELRTSFTINTAGTITFGSAWNYSTGTLTYTAGTVVTTGNTLTIGGANTTFNCASITWNDVAWNPLSSTITLSANFNVSGNCTINHSGTNTISGAFNFNIGGNFTQATGGNLTLSSAIVVLNGTGLWTQAGTASLRGQVNINTAGTVTITGTITLSASGARITYTAGTLVATAATVLFTASGVLDLGGQTVGTIQCTTAGTAITLNSTVKIGTAVVFTGTAASPITLVSNTGGTQRKFTVISGASEDIGYANPTDIDSGDGVPVYAYKPSITNTINWSALTPIIPGSGILANPGYPFA